MIGCKEDGEDVLYLGQRVGSVRVMLRWTIATQTTGSRKCLCSWASLEYPWLIKPENYSMKKHPDKEARLTSCPGSQSSQTGTLLSSAIMMPEITGAA